MGSLGAAVLEGDETRGITEGLNDITRRVAADHQVKVAEVFGLLSGSDWVGGQDCVHPAASGHEKIAGAFVAALGLEITRPGFVRRYSKQVKAGKVRLEWQKVRRAKRYAVRITKPGSRTYRKWHKQTKRKYRHSIVKGKRYRIQLRALGPGGRGPILTVRVRR